MRRFNYHLFLATTNWRLQFLFLFILLLFLIILQSTQVSSIRVEFDQLVGKNTPQTIKALGYPVEGHVIKTADNVLLQYFRIPYGRNSIRGLHKLKPVVLLVHGLMASSYQWLLQDDDKILPEEGYDVWLANSRGVSYSNQLQSITAKNTSFWQFSWHEMGIFDLSAAIDYILKATNQRQVFYIGHSQGTTQLFVLLSERPEYNSKIRLMVALAPVAYLSNVRGLNKLILLSSKGRIPIPTYIGVPRLLTSLGVGEFYPAIVLKYFHHFAPLLCNVEPVQTLCLLSIFSNVGFDFKQFNKRKWPHFLRRIPETSFFLSSAHYNQLAISKQFSRYDHGPVNNLKTYGIVSPPSYNISRIKAPVALFWTDRDFYVHPNDVERLATQLRNVALNYRVPFHKFNHSDFVYGIDAYYLVYVEVLRLMAAYR